MFSLNNFEKYPKNSYLDTKSLWCYEDYGPSFHYDLYFLKGKIYIINFYKSNYFTPNNWVDIDQCYKDNNGVILDSLEIFQIFEENYNFDELPIDNNINFINHINNNFNINNINNINLNNKDASVNNEGKITFINNKKNKKKGNESSDLNILIKKDSKKIQKQNRNEKEKENIQKSKEVYFNPSEIKPDEYKSLDNLNDAYDEMFDNDKKSDNKSLMNILNNYEEELKAKNRNLDDDEDDE